MAQRQRNNQRHARQLGFVLLSSLALSAVAQTKTATRWGTAVGGTTAGDAALLMATDGDRRYISATLGSTGGNTADDFYEFTWSDGINMKRVGPTPFLSAKITGEQDLTWVKQPRMCVTDGANTRVCQTRDDPYAKENINSVLGMGVGSGGRPVALVKYASEGTYSYTFQQLWWNWATTIAAETSRINIPGNLVTSTDSTTNTKQTEPASLSLISSAYTTSRFYALFQYTGDVVIGTSRTTSGKLENVKRIRADATYIQTCAADDYYDIIEGSVVKNSAGAYAPTYCRRTGYLLVALDIFSGNVIQVQPIWLQGTGTWAAPTGAPTILMTASSFDNAVYFGSSLNHRLVFGTPTKFDTNSVLSAFPTSTVTVMPDVDSTKTNKATPVLDFVSYACNFLFRVDADGNVGSSILKTPVLDTTTYKTTPSLYARTSGLWGDGVKGAPATAPGNLVADDSSTKVFLGGYFQAAGTVTSGGNNGVTKLYLGPMTAASPKEMYPTQTFVNSGVTSFDTQDAWIAGFDGSSLASGPSFITPIYGKDDAPVVETMAAQGGKVFALVKFQNASIVGATSDITNGVPTTANWAYAKKVAPAGADRALFILDSSGSFVDSATMYTDGAITVTGFSANGGRAYVFGTFTSRLVFDYLDPTAVGTELLTRGSTPTIFQATFGADMPKSEGSDRQYYNKGIKWGVGIGVGVGVPVVLGTLVGLYFIAKKISARGGHSSSGAKVAPNEP